MLAGWSVWHEVMLLRDLNGPMVPTDERPQLGQLLIKKANEGVRVLILQCASICTLTVRVAWSLGYSSFRSAL